MGGTPRGKDKPRPSYEDGGLRDASIEAEMDQGFNPAVLRRLIRAATKTSDDAGGTPANRA